MILLNIRTHFEVFNVEPWNDIWTLQRLLPNTHMSNITLLPDRGILVEEFYKKNGFKETEIIIFLHKKLHL